MQGAFQRVRVRLNAKETTHPFKMVQTADVVTFGDLFDMRTGDSYPCFQKMQLYPHIIIERNYRATKSNQR